MKRSACETFHRFLYLAPLPTIWTPRTGYFPAKLYEMSLFIGRSHSKQNHSRNHRSNIFANAKSLLVSFSNVPDCFNVIVLSPWWTDQVVYPLNFSKIRTDRKPPIETYIVNFDLKLECIQFCKRPIRKPELRSLRNLVYRLESYIYGGIELRRTKLPCFLVRGCIAVKGRLPIVHWI